MGRKKAEPQGDPLQGQTNDARQKLVGYVEQIEKISDEIGTLQDDRKAVFAAAKATGFTPKLMRQVIKERAMDREALREEQELLDLYRSVFDL